MGDAVTHSDSIMIIDLTEIIPAAAVLKKRKRVVIISISISM
jgi:hypothetical protein